MRTSFFETLRYVPFFCGLVGLACHPIKGQHIETDKFKGVAVYFGGSLYSGDLIAKPDVLGYDFSTAQTSLGLAYFKRLSGRLEYESRISFNRLYADDNLATGLDKPENMLRYARNLHFRNDLLEASGMFKLAVLKSKGHYSDRRIISPYLSFGLAAFYHSPKAFTPKELGGVWVPLNGLRTEGDTYSPVGISIPYGMGVNVRLSPHWDLGLHFTLRKTYTDKLDDVSGSYLDLGVFETNALSRLMSDRSREANGLSGLARNIGLIDATLGKETYVGKNGDSYSVFRSFLPGSPRGNPDGQDDTYASFGFSLRYILSNNKNVKTLSRIYNTNSNPSSYIVYGRRKNSNDFFKHENRYEIEMLAINSEKSEFAPAFYKNGLLFVSDYSSSKLLVWRGRKQYYNFFYTPTQDLTTDVLTKPIVFDTKKYFGFHLKSASCVSAGYGSAKMLFSMVEKMDGSNKTMQHKLYLADVIGDREWGNIEELPFGSSEYSVSQPAMSPDGNTLYFVSDQKGGQGGTDIYVSFKCNGTWTMPVNLGLPVNTKGNELHPFVHGDGLLYFSSDGHEGLGGVDIFEAIGYGDEFTAVKNLGFPINSENDDFALILDKVKRVGYFSSNREGGKGGNDIYMLNVETLNRSRKLTDDGGDYIEMQAMTLKGTVFNSEKGIPVPGAIVKLLNTVTDDVALQRANKKGEFSFDITNEARYEIMGSMVGYQISKSITASTIGIMQQEPIEVKISLDPIRYRFTATGNVIDKITQKALKGAQVVFVDTESNEETVCQTDENGLYAQELKQNKKYLILVSEDGYRQMQHSLSTMHKATSETRVANFELERLNEEDK